MEDVEYVEDVDEGEQVDNVNNSWEKEDGKKTVAERKDK